MGIDRSDKARRQREPTNIVREVLCGNYDPKIMPAIENRLREAARIQAAKRASIAKLTRRGVRGEKAERLVEAVYKHFPLPPKKAAGSSGAEVSRMEIDRRDTTQGQRHGNGHGDEAEAERVETMKRAAIAKYSKSFLPDIAKALVEAVYEVFPPPPPEKAARSSRAKGKPDEN
jgi:hypothetical protein